jgi:hypothetical protein
MGRGVGHHAVYAAHRGTQARIRAYSTRAMSGYRVCRASTSAVAGPS